MTKGIEVSPSEAQRVLENLRAGIPPTGFVRHFTVGRESEIAELEGRLRQGAEGALLVQADYGLGKSHLLKYIRELALEQEYVVSLLSLDIQSGATTFNRLDMIVSQVLRALETPESVGSRGVRHLLDACRTVYNTASDDGFWSRVSNRFAWDFDRVGELKSGSVYVALRAWLFADEPTRSKVEDWLLNLDKYHGQKVLLYRLYIEQLRKYFRDPRTDRQIYGSGIFDWKVNNFQQSWDMLSDVHSLAHAAGYKGFVLLVDELETVLANISRKSEQQDAFWNLFQFFGGRQFTGYACFAVTPAFVENCKQLLLRNNVFDYDYSQFDQLPSFVLKTIDEQNLNELKLRIAEFHRIAYGACDLSDTLLADVSEFHTGSDRVRSITKYIVQSLDQCIETPE